MSDVTERGGRDWLVHWFLGLLVGGVVGLAPLVIGTVGIALAIPTVLWALLDRPRGSALGSWLVGVGVAWFVVWARVVQSCVGPNTPDQGCVGPDPGWFLAVPVILLAAGGLISFLTALRQ